MRPAARIAAAAFDLGHGHLSRCHYHDQRVPRETAANAGSDDRIRSAECSCRFSAIENLSKTFGPRATRCRRCGRSSSRLAPGETLGLVGESGSGKTTFARLLLGLLEPDGGSKIMLDGKPLAPRLAERTIDDVKALQIVFQNPDSALNRVAYGPPHHRPGDPAPGRSRQRRASWPTLQELMEAVRAGRPLSVGAGRGSLSGGMKQRVAIARAFAGDPRIVVCDEPTSALDVSVQAAILNLLADLQTRRQVSYIFISHDLGVVRYLSDRIAVLYLGRLMEIGPADQVFAGPHHPYTEALLSAVPAIDDREIERIRLSGEIPSAINPPSGLRLPHALPAQDRRDLRTARSRR